jgi:DedD protein
MEDNDAQTQLKKRARRRLVGAVFFVSVVALVLPMIMDHDPRPPVQDVEISIPGQDDKAFAPRFAAVPLDGLPDKSPPAPRAAEPAPPAAMRTDDTPREPLAKTLPDAMPAAKPGEKALEKPVKPVDKPEPPAKVVEPVKDVAGDDAKRAAAILAGQSPAAAAPAASANGEHLVLIGAFANQANVLNLRKKLGEQGIKTFTEPLDTPQGKKIRVRAGPFPTRAAAEKALEKMKRIGISGVVAAKP